MSDKNNLELWNALEKTPPSATKQAYVRGQRITSINGLYVVKRATEQFGPVGLGWGYEIIAEKYDDTFPIYDIETKKEICVGKNHTIHLRLWYMRDGSKCSVSHFGHTRYIYESKGAAFVDEEAPKKSLTDAIKKCLSMIGICADVFMGQFDDPEYVSMMSDIEKIGTAESKVDETERQMRARDEFVADTCRLIDESINLNMLKGVYSAAIKRATIRDDRDAVIEITEAKDKKKQELSK